MNATGCTQIMLVLMLTFSISGINAQQKMVHQDVMVRIAEMEIVPEYLNEYKNILREEAAVSVKIEAGVIVIFPMFELQKPNQVRIIEIYANKEGLSIPSKNAPFSALQNFYGEDGEVLETGRYGSFG